MFFAVFSLWIHHWILLFISKRCCWYWWWWWVDLQPRQYQRFSGLSIKDSTVSMLCAPSNVPCCAHTQPSNIKSSVSKTQWADYYQHVVSASQLHIITMTCLPPVLSHPYRRSTLIQMMRLCSSCVSFSGVISYFFRADWNNGAPLISVWIKSCNKNLRLKKNI